MPRSAWIYGLFCCALSSACSSTEGAQPASPAVPAGATWSASFGARALDLSVAPDGSVVVRLASAPWLVRHDARGQPHALAPESNLAWASGFVVADDGSLYLGGAVPASDGGEGNNVRIEHLTESGASLSSTEWQLPGGNSTAFAAITRGSGGAVDVLATNEAGQAVVRLTSDGEIDAVVAVPLPSGARASDFALPARLAQASDGSYSLQGGSSALWIEGMAASGSASTAWSLQLADNQVESAVYAGGIVPAPQGGWFAAVGTGVTDSAGLGFYHRGVVRLSADGRRLWGAGDYFEPRVVDDDAGLRHVSLALLDDSVLLAAALPDADSLHDDDVTLSADKQHATLVRYTLKGDLVAALGLGAVQDAARSGPETAVFLESDPGDPNRYTVQRFDFEPLSVALVSAGDACSAGPDCESGACCASSTGLFAVTCSATSRCHQDDYCLDDSTCDGVCLTNSESAGQGFCAAACSASSDCPFNHACIDARCLPSCTSALACPYRGTQCAQATSAEADLVSVCTAATAP